jgi:hypothetical protein
LMNVIPKKKSYKPRELLKLNIFCYGYMAIT